ncbi:MAG: tetratricopeptide repeat protein [bacterium]|nr:tetratricopeptide repeat protein [bacterium]
MKNNKFVAGRKNIPDLFFLFCILTLFPAVAAAQQNLDDAERLFLQAHAQFQQQNYSTAVMRFQRFLAEHPQHPLGDYAYFYQSDALSHSARYEKARTSLRKLRTHHPQSLLLDDAEFLDADSWFYQGKADKAIQAYLKLKKLKKYRKHPLLPGLYLKLAQAYEQQQQFKTALANYHDTRLRFIASPVYESAKISEERLAAQHPDTLDFYTNTLLFSSAETLVKSGKAKDALPLLTMLETRILSSARQEKLALQKAYAYYMLRDNLRAKALYRQFLRDFPKSTSTPYVLDRIGRLYLRQTDMQGFLRIYDLLLKAYPTNSYTASTRRLKGKELMLLGNLQNAAAEFKTFLQKHPKSSLTSDVLWNAGWCAYQLENYTTAQQYLARLLRSYPKSYHREEARYWAGRTSEKLKQYSAAVTYYQQIVKNARNSYFGTLSREALARLKRTQPKLNISTKAAELKTLGWEGNVRFSTQGGKLHLKKSAIFEKLGLVTLASREMTYAVSKDAGNHTQYLELARFYVRSGQYNELVRLMQGRFWYWIVQGDDSLPREFWQLAYPLSYPQLVSQSAKRNGIDPALVLSLMFAESAFDPEAFSPSGAIGLMQLMPATGARLAREEAQTIVSEQDYFQPPVNIALGARYLRDLSKLFDNHLPPVIAGYNAGEHRVITWWNTEQHQQDVARFISNIPYKETWRYVQKVLWYYREYHRIYGTKNS